MGSTVHGLNVNDGIEDRDEMGICVEPFEDAMSLWEPFEQFIYRSAAEREGRENARSTAGDLDLTIYSLRKWARLALKGNPTIMLLLFTPEEQLVLCDDARRGAAGIDAINRFTPGAGTLSWLPAGAETTSDR